MTEIAIFGAGGHAKVVIDVILKQGVYKPVAVFSLEALTSFAGLPHFHFDKFRDSKISAGVVAIGDNWLRSKVVENILAVQADFKFVSVVHPSAQVGSDVKILRPPCNLARHQHGQ